MRVRKRDGRQRLAYIELAEIAVRLETVMLDIVTKGIAAVISMSG